MRKSKISLKKIFIWIGCVIGVIVVLLVSYVLCLNFQYYRIDDNITVPTENNTEEKIAVDKEYKIATYNIGFGAYSDDFTFFMDTGEMLTGEKSTGKSGKAVDKRAVLTNTNGAIKALYKLQADFYLCQEVDTKSTRSYKVNQVDLFEEFFNEHSTTFAENYHSGFLAYPFLDPIGASNSGILTLSKFNVSQSVRRQLPLEESFFGKMTDLDRCFLVSRIPTENNKELIVINTHQSAYQSGELKKQQMELLNEVLKTEQEKGNYVIVGGDFNMDITNSIELFKTEQKIPSWIASLEDDDIIDGYNVVKPVNNDKVPSCRNADIPYQEGVSYTAVIDGFIVSDNITASSENIDEDFKYSDHNPVLMNFTLQK